MANRRPNFSTIIIRTRRRLFRSANRPKALSGISYRPPVYNMQ